MWSQSIHIDVGVIDFGVIMPFQHLIQKRGLVEVLFNKHLKTQDSRSDFCKSLISEFITEYPNFSGHSEVDLISILDKEVVGKMSQVLWDLAYNPTYIPTYSDFMFYLKFSIGPEQGWYKKQAENLTRLNASQLLQCSEDLRLALTRSIARKMNFRHDFYEIYKAMQCDWQDGTVGHWCEMLQDLSEVPEILQQLFEANIQDGKIHAKFTVGKKKPWSDIYESDMYFDRVTIDALIRHIEKMKHLDSKSSLLAALRERQKYLLDDVTYGGLKLLIDEYHAIDKVNSKQAFTRSKKLIAISEKAEKLNADASNPLLNEIQQQAQLKAKYIRSIAGIHDKLFSYAFRLRHDAGLPLAIDRQEPMKDLDPYHRDTAQLEKIWEKECEQDEHTPSFWFWLEGQPEYLLEQLKVDPRFKRDPKDCIVQFKEGMCFNALCSTTEDHKIADGVYVYNISSSGHLRILPTESKFSKGEVYSPYTGGGSTISTDITYNHNTVTQEESVICAGCICFKGGKITLIDTNSGHFKPTMRQLQNGIKKYLLPEDIFSPDAIVRNYKHEDTTLVMQFISNDFDIDAISPLPYARDVLEADRARALEKEGRLEPVASRARMRRILQKIKDKAEEEETAPPRNRR